MTSASTLGAIASGEFRPTPPTPAGPGPNVTLVSHYQLNGGSGIDIQSAVNGTVTGIWTAFDTGSLAAGDAGTSFFKNGGLGYVSLPASQAAHNLNALTLSFLYQPYASDNKHNIFAVGDGAQIGDLSIERNADDTLRAWHVGADGGLRQFGTAGNQGIIGTNLVAHTAYRITLTLGPGGAKIYLDSALVASRPENTNGWNNARAKIIGIWSDFAAGPVQGVIDNIQLWDGELELSGVAALPAAQSTIIAIGDPTTLTVSTSGNLISALTNDVNLPTNRTITITEDTTGGASVVNNGTPTADISVNAPATPGSYVVKYTVNGSNEATVPITVSTGSASIALPAVPSAPGGSAIYVSSGEGTGAATQGTDSPGRGTLALPYRTVQYAINNSPADGGEIVMRKGLYAEFNLNTTGHTNLTIKSYRTDVLADPTDPTNWGIFDGQIQDLTWSFVSGNEYKTNQTGSGLVFGYLYDGTDPVKWSSYSPVTGWDISRRPIALIPYNGTSGRRSYAAMLGGAPTGTGMQCYHGPGVYRHTDGTIRCVLRPIDAAYVEGDTTYASFPSSTNPNNHTLHLYAENTKLFLSIASGLTFETAYRNYFHFYKGGVAPVGLTLRNSIGYGASYGNTYGGHFVATSGSGSVTFDHHLAEGGLPPWSCWHYGKSISENGGLNWGLPWQIVNFASDVDFTVVDSAVLGYFEPIFHQGNGDISVSYSYFTSRDDMGAVWTSLLNWNIDHTVVWGPMFGWVGGHALGGANQWSAQYNIVHVGFPYVQYPTQRNSMKANVSHVGAPTGFRHKVGNCTFIVAGEAEFPNLQPGVGYPYNQGQTTATEPWVLGNSIVIGRGLKYTPNDELTLGDNFTTADTARRAIVNGNIYWRVLDAGFVGTNRMFSDVRQTSGGGTANFTTLAAAKADVRWTASNVFGAGFTRDASSSEKDPQLTGGTSTVVRDEVVLDRPNSDYIPVNGQASVNMTTFGIPNPGYVGALDPSGDGTEVGPRLT